MLENIAKINQKVWNEEIKKALKDTRMAHKEWREAGKPNEGELIKTK
jgi:hypothetical protein